MAITKFISTLQSIFDAVTQKHMSNYCFLTAAVGKDLFIGKDGSLVSLIELDGVNSLHGPDEFLAKVEHLQTKLSSYLDRSGHAIQVSFTRNKDHAPKVVGNLLTPSHKVAKQLELDLDDLLNERESHLTNQVSWDACYFVLWTRCSVLTRQELKTLDRELNDLSSEMKCADAQNPLRLTRLMHERHAAFVENLQTDLGEIGIRAKIMEIHDAVNVIKSSINPKLFGSNWRPVLVGDQFRTRLPEISDIDSSHLMWPTIEEQLFDHEAEIVNQRVFRMGDLHFSSIDMVIGPQITEKFSTLLNRMSEMDEIPWRVSFLLEHGGVQSQRVKGFLASMLQLTNSSNRQVREAIEGLEEAQLSGIGAANCRVSFATWAPVGDEYLIESRLAHLQKCAEGWGHCKTSALAGDPVSSVMSSVVGLDTHSTAPVGLIPWRDIITMLPWERDTSPWENGSVIFKTPDGRAWPFQIDSTLRDTNVDLIFGPPGKGKSVLLNTFNLAHCLNPHSTGLTENKQLPRISIIDIGPSSSGLISLLRESLPVERRFEAAYHRLQMSREHAINPFDTQLGCRYPLQQEKSFLVNFLTMLGTEIGETKPPAGLSGILNAAVDLLYERFDDSHRNGLPRTYNPKLSPVVDRAVADMNFPISLGKTTWWDIVDALFERKEIHLAILAQRYAVPLLEDVMGVLRDHRLLDIHGEAKGETGEPLIDMCSRMISNAIRELPVLQCPTKFDIGNSRVISLDLDEVAPKGGGSADRQTALMYMLARFVTTRDLFLTSDSDSQIPNRYQTWFRTKARQMLETPKRLVYDEFHRTANTPTVREQIMADIREGRKWGIDIALSSQLLQDFDKGMVDMASGYWIMGTANDRTAKEAAKTFGLSQTAESYARTKLTGPGRNGAPILAILDLKDGIHEHLLHLTLGPHEIWAFSTTAEDSELRRQLYDLLGPIEARKRLAARFVTGTAKYELENRLSRMLENNSEDENLTNTSVIRTLVEEISSANS